MPVKASSAKVLPTDLPIRPFASASGFEAFLEREHSSSPGIHLKLAKKASGIASISGAEAVETALCYGWIDGQANGVDADWWLVRFTPRRAKSIWSKKNVDTVARLMREDRMRPAGIAAVDAAKADGRWDRAYAGPATIVEPDDFRQALKASPTAEIFFNNLNRSDRYAVLWRLETAAASTRANRIEAMIEMLAVGNVPGRPTKQDGKSKKPKELKKATKPLPSSAESQRHGRNLRSSSTKKTR